VISGFRDHLSHAELAEFAEGEFDPTELDPEVEHHLKRCARCRARLQGHRETAILLRKGGSGLDLPVPVPMGFRWEPLAALAVVAMIVVLSFGGWTLVTTITAGGSPTPTHIPAPTRTPRPTPTPTPTPTPEPTFYIYRIQQGDTLKSIAGRFGITYEALLAANPAIYDPSLIKIGQHINIPWPGWTPSPPPY
jgi:LysM repeat protein